MLYILLLFLLCSLVCAAISAQTKKSKVLDKQLQTAKAAPEPSEPKRIPCPRCAERILPEARVCRFCGHDVKAPALALPANDSQAPEIGVNVDRAVLTDIDRFVEIHLTVSGGPAKWSKKKIFLRSIFEYNGSMYLYGESDKLSDEWVCVDDIDKIYDFKINETFIRPFSFVKALTPK